MFVPQHTKVLIIGSGPAGYTAAIYAGRAQLEPILLAGERPGGQLMYTTDVENFPGFPNGKSGQELMTDMLAQAERFGTQVKYEYATAVDFSVRPFKVWNTVPGNHIADAIFHGGGASNELGDGDITQLREEIIKGEPAYTADTVILAVGATSIMLNVPGETEFLGRGVSTCAVCDAAFYKDKETFVVGGGDSAMEDSLALTKFAKHVTIVHRREAFKASKIMQERVLNHPKISVLWNSQITEVLGNGSVKSIKITSTEGEKEVPADGVFIAIGHKPMTDFVKGQLELDGHGYIVTRASHSKAGVELASKNITNDLLAFPTTTSIAGVFAAGDGVDVRYKQAITAAGMGCQAALDAERYLESR